MFPGVLETPLQFIFVTSLSNKRYAYHLWLLVITKKERKKTNKFNRLQIEVLFLPNISPPVYINLPPPTEYRPIKFVLCPYIRPGRINGILRLLIFLQFLLSFKTANFHDFGIACISWNHLK